MFLCDKERVFLCDKERVFLCDKERVFFVDAKLHITNGKAAIYCPENRLPVLSCHPGTYYLCKEKCRYCPRIRGIGDHGKVQGHPPTFLGNTNTIGDPTHSPTLWLASVGTYTQKAGDPTPVPRAGERMYVPTRRKRKGEGSGRSGAGSG